MKEKKIINFKPKIKDSITESEIENFILENLDYNTENKEEDNKNDL